MGLQLSVRVARGEAKAEASAVLTAQDFAIENKHRAGDLLVATRHGVCVGDASVGLQWRWHAYAYSTPDGPAVAHEIWVGNGSINRFLGYIDDADVTIEVQDGAGVHTVTLAKGLYFDGTGYWTRVGALPCLPLHDAQKFVPQPTPEMITAIPVANKQWKPPENWKDAAPDATGFDRVHGDPRRWAKVTYTGTTGSPMAVAVIPREVAALFALVGGADDAVSKAFEMLDGLLCYTAQQARRPYHYWEDDGEPYNMISHSAAIIGSMGFSGLWSHKELYGRNDPTKPKPPKPSQYNSFDQQHLETDRAWWAYVLTGSRMALDEFFLVVEAQRAYPMAHGAVVRSPRTWAWTYRAVARAWYTRQLLDPQVLPQCADYGSVVIGLHNSFIASVKYPHPFAPFPDEADRRHLFPTKEEVEVYSNTYYGLLPPDESDAVYALLVTTWKAAIATGDPKKITPAYDAVVDYLLKHLEVNRGKDAVYNLKSIFSYVPIDQIAITIGALLSAMRVFGVGGDPAFWARARDMLQIIAMYMLQRGINNATGGTFFQDVGAYLPDHVSGGYAKDGTRVWMAGACAALALELDWWPKPEREKFAAAAHAVLHQNKEAEYVDEAFYTWAWFYPRLVAAFPPVKAIT